MSTQLLEQARGGHTQQVVSDLRTRVCGEAHIAWREVRYAWVEGYSIRKTWVLSIQSLWIDENNVYQPYVNVLPLHRRKPKIATRNPALNLCQWLLRTPESQTLLRYVHKLELRVGVSDSQ